MTIDHIATLSSPLIADQANTSREDQSFQRGVAEAYCDSLHHAPSVPDLSRSASGGTPRLIATAPRPEAVERARAVETDAHGLPITDILPSDQEFSESGWDRDTAVRAGAAFAAVSGALMFGPVPATPIRNIVSAHEQEVQQLVDRYRKWLAEMCRRTVDIDADLSGSRIRRLRNRRDREFERIMRRHSSVYH